MDENKNIGSSEQPMEEVEVNKGSPCHDWIDTKNQEDGSPGINNSPEEQLSPSSVPSDDMGRVSPSCMYYTDDAASDDGRGSDGLTTNNKALSAGITSSWVSSGGECYGSLEYSDDVMSSHRGLGYEGSNSSDDLTRDHARCTTSFLSSEIMPGTRDDDSIPPSEGVSSALYSSDVFVGSSGGPSSQNNPDDSTAATHNAINQKMSEDGNNIAATVDSAGPTYGPLLPWQPFGAPLEDQEHPLDLAGRSVAGECGLQNLGNTCFMAAGLQCLVNTPPFTQYFFENPEPDFSLAASLSELIHKMWSGRYSCIRPSSFKYAFGMLYRDFRDYRQHDCQEFVTILLEGLRKQMSQKVSKNNSIEGDAMDTCKGAEEESIEDCNPDTLFGGPGWNSAINDEEDVSDIRPKDSGAAALSSNSSTLDLPPAPVHEHGADCCMMRLDTEQHHSPTEDMSSLLLPCNSLPSSPPSPRAVMKTASAAATTTHSHIHEFVESHDDDSGTTSPKSSVSSSSVDSHLVNLRLQPIPEEVLLLKATSSSSSNFSSDEARDLGGPDSTTVMETESSGVSSSSDPQANMDGQHSEPPLPDVLMSAVSSASSSTSSQQQYSSCGVVSSTIEEASSSLGVNILDIMKESKMSNVNVLVKKNQQNNELVYDSEKYAKCEKVKLQDSLDNLSHKHKRVKDINILQYKNNISSSSLNDDVKGKRSNLDVVPACESMDFKCSSVIDDQNDDSSDCLDCTQQTLKKRIKLDEKNMHHEQQNSAGSSVSNIERAVNINNSNNKENNAALNERLKLLAEKNAERDLTLAQESWKNFVGEGDGAMLMDTFYGQFKSCLVCSVCGHSSVKFDPFGTLSVPLPHANEMQIVVTYMSSDSEPALKCLLTVCKISDVSQIKTGLVQLLAHHYETRCYSNATEEDHQLKQADDSKSDESTNENAKHGFRGKKSEAKQAPQAKDIVVTEVFDNHIARMLDDHLHTKTLNQTTRSIYAFHLPPVAPPPSSPTSSKSSPPMPDIVPADEQIINSCYRGSQSDEGNTTSTAPLHSVVDSSTQKMDPDMQCFLLGGSKLYGSSSTRPKGVYCGIDGGNASCGYSSSPSASAVTPFIIGDMAGDFDAGGGGGIAASTSAGVNGGAGGGQAPPSMSSSGALGLPSTSALMDQDSHRTSSSSSNLNRLESLFDVPNQHMSANSKVKEEVGGDVSEWKTCNICLDEMCQSDLMSHGLCYDCLLCENCIKMSYKHHGGVTLPCPVCQAPLTRAALIPVAKRQTQKPKPRLLRVCVVFRLDTDCQDNNKRTSSLIGHPRLICVQSRLALSALHAALKQYVPPGAEYTLLLVDGRGYNCSRCLFMSHCRGCEITSIKSGSSSSSSSVKVGKCSSSPCDDIIVNLQAGDTICIKFTKLSAVQHNFLTQTWEHESLALRRQNEPLTLYDCLRAFTRSETLECSESWFCPECQCKQSATKTVSLWRSPPYLIIHLERFLFHGTMSGKVDDKVIFPLENLCMDDYFGGRQTDMNNSYNLYGVVCHIGSIAQAGHYTALVKSPFSGKWRLFNDENYTYRKPCEDEFSSAYLLFYYRNDIPFTLNLPLELSVYRPDCSKGRVNTAADMEVDGSSSSERPAQSPMIDIGAATEDDVLEFDKGKQSLKSSQRETVASSTTNATSFSQSSSSQAVASSSRSVDTMESQPADEWVEASVSKEATDEQHVIVSSPGKSPTSKPSPSGSSKSSTPSKFSRQEESSSSSLELFTVSSSDTSMEDRSSSSIGVSDHQVILPDSSDKGGGGAELNSRPCVSSSDSVEQSSPQEGVCVESSLSPH